MSKNQILRFDALAPVQSPKLTVFTFVAKATEIARIARIERAGRSEDGALQGFQRPQIANHIREIRDYLEKPNSILPNAIVVAFTGHARLDPLGSPKDRRRPTAVHRAIRASRS
jgi:DGQHR domain-containing protein